MGTNQPSRQPTPGRHRSVLRWLLVVLAIALSVGATACGEGTGGATAKVGPTDCSNGLKVTLTVTAGDEAVSYFARFTEGPNDDVVNDRTGSLGPNGTVDTDFSTPITTAKLVVYRTKAGYQPPAGPITTPPGALLLKPTALSCP